MITTYTLAGRELDIWTSGYGDDLCLESVTEDGEPVGLTAAEAEEVLEALIVEQREEEEDALAEMQAERYS